MAASTVENVHMLENSSDSEIEEDDEYSDDEFDGDEEEILNDAIEDGDDENSGEDNDEEDEEEEDEDKDEKEDEGEESGKKDEEKPDVQGHGLANVMTRILTKKVPANKVILAKALTDKQLEKRKLEKEENEDGEEKKEDTSTRISYKAQLEKTKRWENMARVKPDPLERNKERQLQRIATRGVVQLFNAVKKQQKVVEEEVKKVKTDKKKEQVMADMTKYKFLDILKGTSTSNVQMGPKAKKLKTEIKEEKPDENEKKWNILREDYMMGAKMKDWNKSSDDDDDGDDDGPPDPDISDSD